MVSDHNISESLLHQRLCQSWSSSFYNLLFWSDFGIKVYAPLVSFYRTNGGVRRGGWSFQSFVVICCFIPRGGLLPIVIVWIDVLWGSWSPQPKVFSHVWMGIIIRHIQHAVKDDVSLCLWQGSLRVFFTSELASFTAKIVYKLNLTAASSAIWIHRHGFEALFNRHFVGYEEILEFHSIFKHFV